MPATTIPSISARCTVFAPSTTSICDSNFQTPILSQVLCRAATMATSLISNHTPRIGHTLFESCTPVIFSRQKIDCLEACDDVTLIQEASRLLPLLDRLPEEDQDAFIGQMEKAYFGQGNRFLEDQTYSAFISLIGRSVLHLSYPSRLKLTGLFMGAFLNSPHKTDFFKVGFLTLKKRDLSDILTQTVEKYAPIDGDSERSVFALQDYLRLTKKIPAGYRQIFLLSLARALQAFPVAEQNQFYGIMEDLIKVVAEAGRLSKPENRHFFARVLFHWASDYPQPDEGRGNYDNFDEGKTILAFRRALKSLLKLEGEADILTQLKTCCGKKRWTPEQVRRLSHRLGIKRPWITIYG